MQRTAIVPHKMFCGGSFDARIGTLVGMKPHASYFSLVSFTGKFTDFAGTTVFGDI